MSNFPRRIKITPARLRKAAEAVAKRRFPDQCGSVDPNAFENGEGYAQVRLSGGTVFVTRDEAIKDILEEDRWVSMIESFQAPEL